MIKNNNGIAAWKIWPTYIAIGLTILYTVAGIAMTSGSAKECIAVNNRKIEEVQVTMQKLEGRHNELLTMLHKLDVNQQVIMHHLGVEKPRRYSGEIKE